MYANAKRHGFMGFFRPSCAKHREKLLSCNPRSHSIGAAFKVLISVLALKHKLFKNEHLLFIFGQHCPITHLGHCSARVFNGVRNLLLQTPFALLLDDSCLRFDAADLLHLIGVYRAV